MPPPHVIDYLRRMVESDMLLQESNSAHEREVPTSYSIKANFKPSEVRTHSIDNVKREDIKRTGKKRVLIFILCTHTM